MTQLRVLDNPRCSRCQRARALLDERGVDYALVRYLDDPPTAEELREIIAKLDEPAEALVRRDAHFQELAVDPSRLESDEGIVALLGEHPRLLQRPILILGQRAIIARPPERVAELV